MTAGRWLSNLHRSEVKEYRKVAGTRFILGPPRPTETATVVQLERLGMVGVYRRKEGRR